MTTTTTIEKNLEPWLKENLPRFHSKNLPADLPVFQIVPNGLYTFLVQSFLRNNNITPKGMIHVGGHMGHEVLPYCVLGFRNVLIIEPLPEACEKLEVICNLYNDLAERTVEVFDGEPFSKIYLEQCAAGAANGNTTLFITEETGLSSTHKPTQAIEVQGKDLAAVKQEINVPVLTLDSMFADKYDKADFNGIRVNVQGDELNVFKGAVSVLPHLDFVFCEANYDQRYENIPTTEELIVFIEAQGFTLTRHDRLSPTVGNLFFLNNNKLL
jgi:FkbM family methyltransferase